MLKEVKKILNSLSLDTLLVSIYSLSIILFGWLFLREDDYILFQLLNKFQFHIVAKITYILLLICIALLFILWRINFIHKTQLDKFKVNKDDYDFGEKYGICIHKETEKIVCQVCLDNQKVNQLQEHGEECWYCNICNKSFCEHDKNDFFYSPSSAPEYNL